MDRKHREATVVLITGATSGIGQACAQHLARRGYQVFGTGRRAPFPPRSTPEGSPVLIHMDVTQDESVRRAVDYIVERAGRIDVLVNNAGYSLAGAVEDTSIEEAKAQFETNFFGVHRVCRAVLPVMRAQGSGLIVNIGSIAGVIALPFQPFYSATKFALAGFTEALSHEVRPFGIRVTLIAPGDIRTSVTENRVRAAAWTSDSPYASYAKRALEIQERDERHGGSPEEVAILLERIVRAHNPAPHYRVGPFFERVAAVLKGVVPARFFHWAVGKYYGLR